MRVKNLLTIHLSCSLLAMGGCDPGDDGDSSAVDDASDIEARDLGISCPPRQCGLNSAEVNGRSIRELNLNGVANADHMKIVGVVSPLGLLGYQLGVENDELVARKGTSVLKGATLIGTTILVKDSSCWLCLPVPIIVLGHQKIDSWAEGAPDVSTYALVYPDLGSLLGQRNICNGDLTDLLATTATVLGGETYDLTSKEVNAGQDGWFTIACPGSAADKLRMFNYGPQSDFDGAGHPATVDQRQATLKMITADYCGEGISYTQNGTPLQWENHAGTVYMSTTLGAVESVWNKDGAVCLGSTRTGIATNQLDCTLPSCSGHTLAEGEWITHVPPP